MAVKLVKAMRLTDLPRLAAVGAGGKTSLLFQLGRELLDETPGGSGSVLLSTTTHLADWQAALADQHLVVENLQQLESWGKHIPKGLSVLSGILGADGRLSGLEPHLMEKLVALGDEYGLALLIEADGARLKPLKAPAAHEPAIPAFTRQVVVCAGMQALGHALDESWVHRPERFAQLSGLQMGEAISTQAVVKVLTHPEGGLKNIPAGASLNLMLTQANTATSQAAAGEIAQAVSGFYERVIIAGGEIMVLEGGELAQMEVRSVHEPVAGIILAAGGSQRFGRPKQLLEWQGKTFVRQSAETALQAGLAPVVVVVGAYAEEVMQALQDLEVQVVVNPAWEQGQGSSVAVGVGALSARIGAALFLLSDQPQVPVSLVRSLVERHAQSLSPITAPLVDGRRGNPVLFDRGTFNELASLQGDQGGRQLFSRYTVQWLPWHDPGLLIDVDSEADYQRLLDLGSRSQM